MRAMLERGAAKIGTLFEWKHADGHGTRVGDSSEGYMILAGNLIFWDTTHLGEMIHDGASWQDPNNPEQRDFRNYGFGVADHYAFCTAGSYSEADHQRWLESDGYDACYRIEHGLNFFNALSVAPELSSAGDLTCVFPALYYDETPGVNNEFKETFHPGLLKRKAQFSEQNEVRALWKPKSADHAISSILIPSSDAKNFVVEHRLLR